MYECFTVATEDADSCNYTYRTCTYTDATEENACIADYNDCADDYMDECGDNYTECSNPCDDNACVNACYDVYDMCDDGEVYVLKSSLPWAEARSNSEINWKL